MSATNDPVTFMEFPPFTFERVAALALAQDDGNRPSASAVAAMMLVVDLLESNGLPATQMRACARHLCLFFDRNPTSTLCIEAHSSGAVYAVTRDLARRVRSPDDVLTHVGLWREERRLRDSADAAAGVDR